MTNKKIWLAMLVLITLTLVVNGCATVFPNKETTLRAESGANRTVTVLENGVSIYNGPLPARFPVKQGVLNTYTVQYTTPEGEVQEFTIDRKFNWWVILDGSWIVGLVVDLVTGNIFHIPKTTTLPINYSADLESGEVMLLIGENLQYHPILQYNGNIFAGN